MSVKSGDIIQVHYTGMIDGNVFDTSYDKDPFEFCVGDDHVIRGFHEAVIGMRPGDIKTVLIPKHHAYGERDEKLSAELPLEKLGDLPNQIDLKQGTSFQLKDKMGNSCIVTVTDLTNSSVILDLNHPLAGKDLTFELQLVDILKGLGV